MKGLKSTTNQYKKMQEKSKSKLKFDILIRENNTIGRLKDYTLESLANKNLYYLGYIQL